MKKIFFSLATVVALSATAFAGKNVAPVTIPPVPVPPKPQISQTPTIIPPLGLYIGGGLTFVKSECQCDTNVHFSDNTTSKVNSAKTYGVNLKAGYTFTEYLAIEAKYLYTPWGDDYKTLKHYGIYIKPIAPVNDNIDVYGLLGYGKSECETLNKSYKGLAWGLGAEYTFGQKKEGLKNGWGVYAEYTRPLKKSGSQNITTNAISGGVSYHF